MTLNVENWSTYIPTADKSKHVIKIDSSISHCCDCPLRNDTGDYGPTLPQGFWDAEVMIVGRNPGEEELKSGIPFVGPSGEMINNMLGEVGLTRRDCWITNVNKCYSHKNRKPTEDEIKTCSKHLKMEIEVIKPKLILTFGNEAMSLLTPYYSGVTRHCGEILDSPKCKLVGQLDARVVVFPHPSYVLRNGKNGQQLFDNATSKLESLLEVFKC